MSREEVYKYGGEKSLGRRGVNVKKMCVSMSSSSEKAHRIRNKKLLIAIASSVLLDDVGS